MESDLAVPGNTVWSDERARTPTRFGSELDRPQGLIQGLVRVITRDSAKATFYSALILPDKPYEIYIPIEATWAYEWRRQWHPTPVLLPEKSHGRRSLVGCSPWGC